ncbi:hypothetical protein BB559_000722, partial [Furculomyces boomerangus]
MSESDTIKIFYASESGNAEAIAMQIANEAKNKSYDVKIHEIQDFLKESFDVPKTAIFVISTFGDGDPPSNAESTFRKMAIKAKRFKNNSESEYANLYYSVLGLGDTNYNNFCNASKTFIKHLKTLKSTEFYPCGFADDGTGLEEVVEPWIANIWPSLEVIQKKILNPPKIFNDQQVDSMIQDLSIKEKNLEKHDTQNQIYFSIENIKPQTIKRKLALDFSKITNTKKVLGAPKSISNNMKIRFLEHEILQNEQSVELNEFGIRKVLKYPFWIFNKTGKLMNNDEKDLEENIYGTFLAQVVYASCMTTQDAVKRTLLLELDIDPEFKSDDGNTCPYVGNKNVLDEWEAGDSFGIVAPNDPNIVAALLDRLNVKSSEWYLPISLESLDQSIDPTLVAGSHIT